MGLIDTISLFGTAVLAIPIGLLGVEFLLRGRTLAGAGFLALGVALLAGQHYLPDLKGEVVDGVAGVVLGDAEGGTDAERSGDRAADEPGE